MATSMMMMTSIISNYFSALNALDREAYLACFTPSASLNDPYGGRPLSGLEGLNKFMDGMVRTWSEFEMVPGEPIISGDRVAVSWTATATAKTGKTAEFKGINIFTINQDGLIKQLDGYWDFKAMIAQLS